MFDLLRLLIDIVVYTCTINLFFNNPSSENIQPQKVLLNKNNAIKKYPLILLMFFYSNSAYQITFDSQLFYIWLLALFEQMT